MTRASAKRERLQARISADQKALFQRAAQLSGRSLTEFVVSSAQVAAEETIRRYQVIELTERDTNAFVEALLNPSGPNEHLRAAARRHRDFLGESDSS